MKKKQPKTLLVIVFSALFFITSILYSVLREYNPYRYFTGLGSELSISPDDERLAFSYFLDGDEEIYTAKINGNEVTKITNEQGRVHTPRFSADGNQLLFLSENNEGIQSLKIMNKDGRNPKLITETNIHVSDAVFSPKGDTVYYIAMPAEDFKKAEGETKEGLDLYSAKIDGSNRVQLTDKDHFSMNDLSISDDGKLLYYSLFDDKEKLYSFSLDEKQEMKANEANEISDDMYSSILSPDKKFLAYTAVSEESKNSSLFEYELFIKNLETSETKQLTNLKTSVQSPIFFHDSNKLVFLEYKNWPSQPEEYQLKTITTEGEKPVSIGMDLPDSEKNHFFMKSVDFLFNQAAIVVYYILLMGGVVVYMQRKAGKALLPSYISIGLAVLLFISSFVLGALTNPWYGIGLGMVAITAFVCSLILLLFAFIIKKNVKPL